jgi:hypothetical protein
MAKKDIQKELDDQRRKVDVDHYDLTVRELVRMAADGELVRAPAYQRKFRWKEEDESRLIESLFLGLPVPSIFVATNKNGSWELVDGLQRLSTLLHFVAEPITVLADVKKNEPLRLSEELGTLKTFRGKTYANLPMPMRLAFGKRSLRVTALSDKSDRKVRFELFERLNTGGVALTPQEVRACIYRGKFADFLGDMAELPEFLQLCKLQDKRQNDGTREELVLKFFAYLDRREKFDGEVKSFLNDHMEASDQEFDIKAGSKLFSEVVKSVLASTQGPVMREGYHSTPLNQFEAILVAAGELNRAGITKLVPEGGWLNDDDLVAASTKGTNTPNQLKKRIERAKELLAGAAVKRAPRAS